MAVTAYQIGISFVSDASKATGPAEALLKVLERIQSAQQAMQASFTEMAGALRGASTAADALARAMGRVAEAASSAERAVGRIKVPVGGAGVDGVVATPPRARPSGSAAGSDEAYEPGTGLVALGSATGGGGPSFRGASRTSSTDDAPEGGIPLTGGRFLNAATSAVPGMVAGRFRDHPGALGALGPYGKIIGLDIGAHGVIGAYEQGSEVGDIIAKMQAMQVMGPDGRPQAAFSPQQIAQAQAQAMATMRRVPGLGYGQALDVTLQTAGLLGNSSKALELTPQLAFNAQVLSRYGKGDAIAQIEKGVQAGELTGLTGKDGQVDVARLLDFVNRLTRTTVAMGGQLDIGKYLTGIRQFGLGAEASSLDFTTATLPAYMKIMGEARAGTALTSLQQVLLAPVPKTRADRYEKEQFRIGLRDKRGNLVNADGLKENTQDYFLQTLLPTLNRAGYSSPGQITEEIQRLLPRQTVDRLAGAGLMDRALIEKEVQRNLAQQRAGDAPLAAMLQNAPGAQFKAFAEGFKALEAVTTDAAMGPTMDIIRRLTRSFENITDYVKGHPDDVKQFATDVDMLLRVLIGVAGFAGKVLGFLPAPLRRGMEGAVVGGVAGSIIPGVGSAAGAVIGGIAGGLNGATVGVPKGWHSTLGGLSMAPNAATVQKQAYTGGVDRMQPIHVSLVMPDGDVLARHVGAYQTRLARQPSAAGNAPDYMEVAPRPGMPLVNV